MADATAPRLTTSVGTAVNGQHAVQFLYSPGSETVSLYLDGVESRQFALAEFRQVSAAASSLEDMIDAAK